MKTSTELCKKLIKKFDILTLINELDPTIAKCDMCHIWYPRDEVLKKGSKLKSGELSHSGDISYRFKTDGTAETKVLNDEDPWMMHDEIRRGKNYCKACAETR